ncbi:DUF5691 domain-containing protein, partial [Streptomyces sp. NPDC054912]
MNGTAEADERNTVAPEAWEELVAAALLGTGGLGGATPAQHDPGAVQTLRRRAGLRPATPGR